MEFSKDSLSLLTSRYHFSVLPERPYIRLETAKGRHLADLFVPGSVNRLGALDDCTKLSDWQVEEDGAEVHFWIEGRSSAWQRKRYLFCCSETRINYTCEVEGTGNLTEVSYFGGYLSATPRWGSGFFWSEGNFDVGFNPEPHRDEIYRFPTREGSTIDPTGVPITGKDGWFFTPPPYCFAFQAGETWLALGLEAEPGQNRYTDFRYEAQRSAFRLSLAFEGHTRINGPYRLPSISFEFAAGPYEALVAHCNALRERGWAPQPVRSPVHWWQEPIFCGWGSQCALAAQYGGQPPDYARQPVYEGLINRLEEHALDPGIVVLDDKWQKTYGVNEVDEQKWPDLTGFIKEQHEAGRKVLLWLKAWDCEGLPLELCVYNKAGIAVSADVTHPEFATLLRTSIRRLLAPEGYDADGIKLDFSARIPASPGLARHENTWGLELMKRYLGMLYREAKAVKADALIMTHTPHPYLADVLDMIRLNDINIGTDVSAAMRHRARVATAACPGALIDTDNWPIADRAAWREYTRLQPELGIPSLYFASHIDRTSEALNSTDYALIREVWQHYRDSRG